MHPVERAESRLAYHQGHVRRLEELGAPDIIVRAARAALRHGKKRLADARAGIADPGQALEELGFEPPRALDEEVEPAHSCAFLGDAIVACDASLTRVLGTDQSWPSPGLVIVAARDGLVFYRHATMTSHHLFDVEAGEWLTAPKRGFPRTFMREEMERAHVVDVANRREWHAGEIADYPSHWCVSGDDRYLWINDKKGSAGIYDGENGDLVLVPDESQPLPLAFVHDGKRFHFFPHKKLLRAAGALAAAFDATGRRLAIIKRREVLLVERRSLKG
jgi:hypothetical protein